MLFLKSLYLYSLTLWVGSMFFFTAVGAPAAFKILKKEEAGKYTGSVFPKYFGIGYILGLAALVSFYLFDKRCVERFFLAKLSFSFANEHL